MTKRQAITILPFLKSPKNIIEIMGQHNFGREVLASGICSLFQEEKTDAEIIQLMNLSKFNPVFCETMINLLNSTENILYVLERSDSPLVLKAGLSRLDSKSIIAFIESNGYNQEICKMAMPLLREEEVYLVVKASNYSLNTSFAALQILKSEDYILEIQRRNPRNVCLFDASIEALKRC